MDASDTVTLTATVDNDSTQQGVTWTLPNQPTSSVSTNSTQATFTPSASITGSLTFVITATSKEFPSVQASITIAVNPLPTISSIGAIVSSTEGTSYSTKLNASGGTGALSWSLAGGTVLPAGLTVSQDGTISGTPQGPAVIGSPFSVQVVDSDTPPHTSPPAQLTLNVYNYALPGFSVSTLPNATVGGAYQQTVTITNGHPPFTIVDAGLPPGLATTVAGSAVDVTDKPVVATGITLIGAPSAIGNHFPITVVVADSSNPVQQNSITYYVDVLPSGNSGAEIVADVSQAGPVMLKDQLGVNLSFTYQDSYNPAFEPLLASASIGLIRWPGGSAADFYHWQDNSISTCDGNNPNPDFDVFMQNIPAALRTDVAITANYGSNADCTALADPNEAAGWVNYANNVQHYGIKYWTVGNEEYYPQEALTPGTFYVIGPATYVNRVNTGFYPLMKAQDPSIMVGVVTAIAAAGVSSASVDPWDYLVLAQAKYDFVEMHYYPFSYNVDDDASLLTTWSDQIGANFAWARAALSLNGHANAPIFLGEYDRDAGGPVAVEHESVSVVNALFTAIVLAEVAKAGIPMASTWVGIDYCYPDTLAPMLTTAYGLQTFGSFGMFPAANSTCPSLGVPIGTAFPKGQAYRMLSQFILPGEHTVAIASTDPSIRAYAATNNGGYSLLLINIDSTSTHTLPVTVSNASRTSYTATSSVYGKVQYEESGQGVWAGPVSSNLGSLGTTFSLDLPAWSMTLVQLQ